MLRAMTSRLAAVLLLLGACSGGTGAPPDARPDVGDKPEVVLATSLGDLVVRLEPVEMPVTTANFLAYVDAGWYDGTLILRVDPDWVIQGGGYTTGLAPKTAMDPIALESSDLVTHVHGAISMARTADPDSATSQWFIVDWDHDSDGPQRDLDGDYAAFGIVIEGLDVLAAITAVSTGTVGDLMNVPVTEITVTSATRR
jgi:peptidyl-prolyl cis-trans isomerase A (cyclophilin A)